MLPTGNGAGSVYRFGLFEVDGRSGELRKQGRPLRIRGRPVDILLILLSRRGDVVSRDDLRAQLWPADTFVDFDHGLNSAVNRLREALGDSAENPRFIETLPKRGYRFIAPIEVVGPRNPLPERPADAVPPAVLPVPDQPPVQSSSIQPPAGGDAFRPGPALSWPSRLVLAGAVLALVAAIVIATVYLKSGRNSRASSRMTLAVLPFENLSSEPDQEFFSDGFTEEMISELGKLDPDHLGVIARTTTRLYKAARKDVGQIRRELGVDYVLEGSIRRAANRIRINAQLVQASDMTNLWSESYDRDVSDALTIQSEVAMKIAGSLALALNRPRATGSAAKSSSAYELYLRGKFFRAQATEESTRKAIDYFQRAITIDSRYAPAYAGMADAYFLLGAPGWEVDQPATLFKSAEANVQRALAIDPDLADAHAVLGMLHLDYRWDAAAAEREIQQAIRLNPSSAQAHQYYSAVLTTMRRFDDAIAEARRAAELDPLSAPAITTLGVRQWYAGRCDEASVQFLKTLESSPEFSVAHWGLAQCFRQAGDTAREIDSLRRAVQLSGKSAYMRAHLAFGLATSGDRAGARAIQRALESEGRERYASPYHQALIAAGFGDRDGMLRALERAFADRSGWMMFLPVEPEFAGVRDLSDFQRLLARVTPMR